MATMIDEKTLANVIATAVAQALNAQKQPEQPARPAPAPRRDLRQQRRPFANVDKKALPGNSDATVREITPEEQDAIVDRRYTHEEADRLGLIGASRLKHMAHTIRVLPSKQGVSLYWSMERDGIVQECDESEKYVLAIPAFMKLLKGKIEFYQNFSYTGGLSGFSVVKIAGQPCRRGIGYTFVVRKFDLQHFDEDGHVTDEQHFDAMRFFVSAQVNNAFVAPLAMPDSPAAKVHAAIISRNPSLYQVSEHAMADYAFFSAHLNAYNNGGGNANYIAAMRNVAKVGPRKQNQAGEWYGNTNDDCLKLYASLDAFRELRAANRARNEEYRLSRQNSTSSDSRILDDPEADVVPFE